jgi:hypothetical protein
MCVERLVRVRVEGQELQATAFVTSPRRASTEGPISQRFIEALVRGAQSAGLPADYLERLRRGE